ncbi:MAG: aminotransferase [Alphaproteobacteria bacterium]|nr:aminotransferase [Alphaproteobacteria bacterium]
MSFQVSPLVQNVEFPPIAEAMSWVKDRASTRELLNMCQAVPSYPPAEILQAEIARLAQQPDMGSYTDIFGMMHLREAFAVHMSADYAGTITADAVAITTGCNQAFAAAIMALAKAGDNVIIPAPFYFNHQMWLSMMGIEIRVLDAFAEKGAPSPADAKTLIDARTRAIVLCSPNNPTGAIYPPSVLHSFYDVAQAAGIALVLDETYKDFRQDITPPHALFTKPNWQKTLVQLYSFSKIYALAGYRLGAMIAGPAMLHEVAKILDCMTICPPHITQRAVLFGLTALDQWKTGKKVLMRGRLDALRTAFNTSGLRYQLMSSGAYFAYVKHPFGEEASKSVAMRLAQKHDVLCLPGNMFGPGQEQFLRFAFANVGEEKMPVLAARLLESQP